MSTPFLWKLLARCTATLGVALLNVVLHVWQNNLMVAYYFDVAIFHAARFFSCLGRQRWLPISLGVLKLQTFLHGVHKNDLLANNIIELLEILFAGIATVRHDRRAIEARGKCRTTSQTVNPIFLECMH